MIVLRIEQADGGFFDRFGSIMREHSEKLEEELTTFSPKLDSRAIFYLADEVNETSLSEPGEKSEENGHTPENGAETAENGAETSENGEALFEDNGNTISHEDSIKQESDSETESKDGLEEMRETSDFIQVGWNVSIIPHG